MRSVTRPGAPSGPADSSAVDLSDLSVPRPRAPLLPRELADAEFSLFLAAGRVREVRAGEPIFRRGELGRSMFVVEQGQVRLEFGEGLADRLIGPREFFGELALYLGNHARLASATAASNVRLHVIDAAGFEELLQREPHLLAQFMRRSFAYLVASEQQLIAGLRRRNEDLLLTLESLRQTRSQLDSIARLVQTDELTELCNRRGLYAFLEGLPDLRMPDTQLGLLLVDIDRFKQVNDRHSHLTGDIVLRALARELQSAAAPCDLACRLGGDEFALLVQVRDASEFEARARQLVMAVRALRFPEPNLDLCTSISVGAAWCDEDEAWSHWYSDADSALFEAKDLGGDQWRVFRPDA